MSDKAVSAALIRASLDTEEPRTLLSFVASSLFGLLDIDSCAGSGKVDCSSSVIVIYAFSVSPEILKERRAIPRDFLYGRSLFPFPATMTLTPAVILSSLKDYTQCNDELVIAVRSTVLEPFQPDLSRIQAGHRVVKPTRAEFKAMTTKLAPLSMRIINQCIESLRDIKSKKVSSANAESSKFLIDSASTAIAALKHMSANTTLKPLDIEKTMSNLICKIVDLGEVHFIFFV